MGPNLPWATSGTLFWQTEKNCELYYEKYGMQRLFCEHSGFARQAIANGATIVNKKAYETYKASGGRAGGKRPMAVIWPIDPIYTKVVIENYPNSNVKGAAEKYKGKPYLYGFIGQDEPAMTIAGKAAEIAPRMKKLDREVRDKYGFGKYGMPFPEDPDYYTHKETHPFQWIAFNRWMSQKYIESRKQIYEALKSIAPDLKYIPCNFWMMEAFICYDFSGMPACGDEIMCDPYPASGERRRGRGIYSPGFGTKLINDLTGIPTWCVIQAFDIANYSPGAEDIREWVSQALKNGAAGIEYYESDCPRQSHPERYKEMLRIASIVTKMNRVNLPKYPDTAILFSSDSHSAEGPSCRGDEVYTAYSLLGEKTGSWFNFISDRQLVRGIEKLSIYKIVYIPLATYQRKSVIKLIGSYVKSGGTVIIGDPNAFLWDIDGENLVKEREKMLGVRLGKELKLSTKEIVLTEPEGLTNLKNGQTFPLYPNYFPLVQRGLGYYSYARSLKAYQIIILDKGIKIIARFKTGEPAIIERKYGKGNIIYFAANPFIPDAVVEPGKWAEFFHGVQKKAGCEIDRPIWQFELPERS